MRVFLFLRLFIKMSIFVLIWRHLKDSGFEEGKRARFPTRRSAEYGIVNSRKGKGKRKPPLATNWRNVPTVVLQVNLS